MRLSQLFGRTLREPPAEAETISHALAARAGLVRVLPGASLAYLPLGWRVMRRLMDSLRAEWSGLGGQEAQWFSGDSSSVETLLELARREVESYRQLPRVVFRFAPRPAAGPRAGGGLLAAREPLLAEAFALALDAGSIASGYRDGFQRVVAWLGALGLPVATVEAEAASQASDPLRAAAVVLRHPRGRDNLLICDACGYAALAELAVARLPGGVGGEAKALKKVLTPDCHTIADLAKFLGIEERQTLKAVFYIRDEIELVFAVVRGDLEVSEAKLQRALGGGRLRPATDSEIAAVGAALGYASPAGLRVRAWNDRGQAGGGGQVTVAADPSIQAGSNFAAGANEAGYHFVNVNYPRDFAVSWLTDIAQAAPGQPCARCGGALRAETAIELARLELVEDRYSATATALDASGRPQPILLAYFAIELDRVLAAILETHHDDAGIIWPRPAAPFDVHLVSLLKSGDQAQRLADELEGAGHTALLDDRPESAGVKFADADLIGCPVRLTVSDRSLKAGGVEWKRREAAEREVVPLEGVLDRLQLEFGPAQAARP